MWKHLCVKVCKHVVCRPIFGAILKWFTCSNSNPDVKKRQSHMNMCNGVLWWPGRRTHSRPKVRWRDYVYYLAWEHLVIPQLEGVGKEKDIWDTLLPLRPLPQISERRWMDGWMDGCEKKQSSVKIFISNVKLKWIVSLKFFVFSLISLKLSPGNTAPSWWYILYLIWLWWFHFLKLGSSLKQIIYEELAFF